MHIIFNSYHTLNLPTLYICNNVVNTSVGRYGEAMMVWTAVDRHMCTYILIIYVDLPTTYYRVQTKHIRLFLFSVIIFPLFYIKTILASRYACSFIFFVGGIFYHFIFFLKTLPLFKRRTTDKYAIQKQIIRNCTMNTSRLTFENV